MSENDKTLTEIRARHERDERWHCGPSVIRLQSHEDRAFLLTEIERLRAALTDAVSLIERLIDTRRCSAADLRTLNAARAALEAKP